MGSDGHEGFAGCLGEVVDFAQDGGWVVAQGGEVWEGVDVVKEMEFAEVLQLELAFAKKRERE